MGAVGVGSREKREDQGFQECKDLEKSVQREWPQGSRVGCQANAKFRMWPREGAVGAEQR